MNLNLMNEFFIHYATCKPSWNPAWTVLTTIVDDSTKTQQFASATPITDGQVLINWGDGTPDTPEIAHTYAQNGEYTVLIKNCSKFSTRKLLNLNTAVQLGTDITSGNSMFESSPLREVKETFYPSQPIPARWMFYYTDNLKMLPDNFIFPNGSSDFVAIFQGSRVGKFSSHIFPSGYNYIHSAFNFNKGLKLIPKELNLHGSANYVFYDSKIEGVESGFKLRATDGVGFPYWFMYCEKFTVNIGEIIDDQTFVGSGFDMTSAFNGAAITGTAPANLLWLDKTLGKWSGTADCFKNCTGLTNYNDIPQSWGGPHAEY